MWGHMFFVSSILLGNDVMWTITKFFEGYFLFGRSYPAIVSCVVATVFALIVVHAFLALRKFPINYRQYATFRDHMKGMRHEDTTLWYWQAVTGFAMFFLASPHLVVMLTRPDRIGPFESSDRMWSDHFWPLYLVLLFAVELHGGIGLYRLAVKWGWLAGPDPERDAAAPEGAQVGDQRVLPGARARHARRVRQDRHRARAEIRRALRARAGCSSPRRRRRRRQR